MRTKDKNTLTEIKQFINDYCDQNGRGPSVGDVAKKCGVGKATAQRYLCELKRRGDIGQSMFGYESLTLSNNRSSQSIPILGAIPCGPLEEVEECIEGYVRLPETFIGKGKFYLLKQWHRPSSLKILSIKILMIFVCQHTPKKTR